MKKRVTIEIIKDKEKHIFPEMGNDRRIIHFNYKKDWDIAEDDQFIKKVIRAMQRNKGVITRYLSTGWRMLKKQMDERQKALKSLEKNAINANEADTLKKIWWMDIPHPNQSFTKQLFKNLVDPYLWLIDHHEEVDQQEAQIILLDILQGWYPDIPRVQEITPTAFKKALNRM